VQGTTAFHHEIADTRLPQTGPVFHTAAALDTAIDGLAPAPPLLEYLLGEVWLQGQLRTTGLLRRPEARPLGERA
jgi:hypothetical protein